jgi:hypothetical protein
MNFSKAAVEQKKATHSKASYQYVHAIKHNEFGRYYFRVKQRWLDGYFRYSEIRKVDFVNPLFSTVSMYPNPSSGSIGIKFVAAKAGAYVVEVSNAVGQVVARKNVQVAATDYRQIAALQKGTYYVKITEQESASSVIHQLIVQ